MIAQFELQCTKLRSDTWVCIRARRTIGLAAVAQAKGGSYCGNFSGHDSFTQTAYKANVTVIGR
jgi:hypothetical protein